MALNKEQFIKKTGLFRKLNEDNVKLVALMAEECFYNKGERIFSEGDKEGALYLIVSGGVILAKKYDDETLVTLAVAKQGDFFGEVSLFDQKEQVVTAVAEEDCQLLALDYASLRGLLVLYPRIAHDVYKAVLELQSQLLRETNQRLKEFLKKACS